MAQPGCALHHRGRGDLALVRPPLVERAQALADRLGLERSCPDEDGLLLHVLAARRGIGRAGAIGTGAAVGAAWIVSALEPSVPFVTVELDLEPAAAATALFAEDEHVRVLTGRWRDVLPPEAPFDFLFVDGIDAKDDPDGVLGLVAPGGMLVMDDVRRDAWLGHPGIVATQLGITQERRAIVAVRQR